MSSTASAMRSFISELASDVVFTTRDVLNLGTRNAVDKNLSKLVKKGIITRLANGVFRKNSPSAQSPSPLEIVWAKAAAFGKRIFKNIEAQLNPDKAESIPQDQSRTFLTDGCRSSFDSIFGRIFMQPITTRMLHSEESEERVKTELNSSAEPGSSQALPVRAKLASKKSIDTEFGINKSVPISTLIAKLMLKKIVSLTKGFPTLSRVVDHSSEENSKFRKGWPRDCNQGIQKHEARQAASKQNSRCSTRNFLASSPRIVKRRLS